MRWTLCRAACVTAWRPVRRALRANPLVAAILVAAGAALPVLAFAAGSSASPAFDAAAEDAALARAFAVAGVVAAVTIGVALAALAPTRASLGPQVAAAPVSAATLFVGLTLLPVALAALPLLALACAFALPATATVGGWAAAAVVSATASSVALGAAGAAAAAAAARRSVTGAVALLGTAGVWLAVGAGSGRPLLGPASGLAAALGEPGPSTAVLLAAATSAALALWCLTAVARPAERQSSGTVRVAISVPRGPTLAVSVTTVARLVRNAQLRRHAATGLTLALLAAIAARVRAPGAAPVAAASVALLTAAAVPLVAAGLRRDAAWLFRAAPLSSARAAAAGAAAGVAAAYGLVAMVLAATAPFGRLGVGSLLVLEATAALVFGAAAASGALLPWRADGVLAQLASYGLLATLTGALTFALGRAAEAAPAVGLTATQLAALAAHLVLVGGIAAAAALDE